MINIDTEDLVLNIKKISEECQSNKHAGKNYATKYCDIAAKFDEFETKYPFIFKQILEGKSLEMIAFYIVYIELINAGKITKEEAEKEIGMYLKEKFFAGVPEK